MMYLGRHIAGLNAITKVVAPPEPVDSSKPVLFRDYDGKVLYSYTVDEIASMASLPPLPTSPSLTCQGWNWTLQQVKDYVASYGRCEVGATYTTDDGKTRIKLTIQDPKYSNISIVFQQTVTNGVKVNWGDGSADQTYSSTSQQTITHQYSSSSYPQTYTITFDVVNGTMSFPNSIMGKSGSESSSNLVSVWTNMIDEVNIGNGVTSIGSYAFYYCYSLTSVTIPGSVMSIGTHAFSSCYSLASVTIPSSVTSIRDHGFYVCYSLTSVTIPSSVTSIESHAFYNCSSLASVAIPSSVTSIGANAFYYCSSLASVAIPSSVTSIGSYTFQGCSSLASVAIPSSVTSIGSYAFTACRSIAFVAIPSSVTSIETYAFQFCYGLKTFDFHTHSSIPTLATVYVFASTPTNREIVVPDALYDDWKAASNWSSTTNNIVGSIVKYSESSIYGG